MNIVTGSTPVRHFVCDDFVTPRPDWTVAPADAPVGVWECKYDNELERGKRTSRVVKGWVEYVLGRMHELETLRACAQLFGIPAYPDALLWGGGLQVLSPNGWLNCHLDGCVHPQRRDLRRAVQMVCFCHPEWYGSWGGDFAFFDPDGKVIGTVEPKPGRLLAFQNTDLAYHGVLPTSADAADRVTVASSLLTNAREGDTRTRALFLPKRG